MEFMCYGREIINHIIIGNLDILKVYKHETAHRCPCMQDCKSDVFISYGAAGSPSKRLSFNQTKELRTCDEPVLLPKCAMEIAIIVLI